MASSILDQETQDDLNHNFTLKTSPVKFSDTQLEIDYAPHRDAAMWERPIVRNGVEVRGAVTEDDVKAWRRIVYDNIVLPTIDAAEHAVKGMQKKRKAMKKAYFRTKEGRDDAELSSHLLHSGGNDSPHVYRKEQIQDAQENVPYELHEIVELYALMQMNHGKHEYFSQQGLRKQLLEAESKFKERIGKGDKADRLLGEVHQEANIQMSLYEILTRAAPVIDTIIKDTIGSTVNPAAQEMRLELTQYVEDRAFFSWGMSELDAREMAGKTAHIKSGLDIDSFLSLDRLFDKSLSVRPASVRSRADL